MGHEFIGIVEVVGAGVATIKAGDLVISPFKWCDGTCVFCREGLHSECLHGGRYGFGDVDGGQGEAVRVPYADGTLVVVPADVDDAPMPSLLALTDVMGTGHHAARAAKVDPGKTAAVIGDGAVGLCGVIACQRLGAERIILLGRNPDGVALAKEFGATDVVSERGEEAVERVRELTGGLGAHSVLECVGTEQAVLTALEIARAGGSVGRVGVPEDEKFPGCPGATLINEGGNALSADGAGIGGGVFLRDGFSATGAVRLLNPKIGVLDCSDATLTNPAGIALAARDATIDGTLRFVNVEVTGGVDLFRASAATLDDDLGKEYSLGSWRGVQSLVLESFEYARFGHASVWEPKWRRRWLEQTSDFQSGAWQQLIRVYRAHGRDDEATRTAIAMQNDRRRRAGLPWYRRAGRRILGAVIGPGYRSWLAAIWATAIIAVFGLVVWHWSGMFIAKEGVTGSPQPVAYAADTFLPIIDLRQADDWTPTGWMRWADWSVILLGWSLSTIFVAGFTRIVRTQ